MWGLTNKEKAKETVPLMGISLEKKRKKESRKQKKSNQENLKRVGCSIK